MTSNFATSDSKSLLVTLGKAFIESAVQTLAKMPVQISINSQKVVGSSPRLEDSDFPESASELVVERSWVQLLDRSTRVISDLPRVSIQNSNLKVVL